MVFRFKECGGCRTCELACSYRRSGDFNPQLSAIEILDNEDEPGFSVFLVDSPGGTRYVCDGCPDDETPMCMQYCHKYRELRRILNEHLARRLPAGGGGGA